MKIEPMQVHVPDADLDDLNERLRRTRWPRSFPEMGWDYGTNTEYMRSLVASSRGVTLQHPIVALICFSR